ncbi:hypothetical protein TcasGA2_TC031268 [Tribolium castaneum]|uniref:Uncharacterized protein n=1 Tax=Tribolium castaneum TaxID=7070 RepID=A0A139WDR0_TRICA|nr:hypothetical protein TcasGA2_TC031268 [Tribolium castaneum]
MNTLNFAIVTLLFSFVFAGDGGPCGPLDACPDGYQCFNSRCDNGLTMGMYRRIIVIYDDSSSDYSQSLNSSESNSNYTSNSSES